VMLSSVSCMIEAHAGRLTANLKEITHHNPYR
jgi:hypothetical protein